MKTIAVLRANHSWRVLVLVLTFGIISAGLLAWTIVPGEQRNMLQVGQVAPTDFTAPRTVEYISQVLTEKARLAAERTVQPVYASPDPAIARNQIERLRTTLDYITLVRQDQWATPEQKIADLQNLRDVHLNTTMAENILALNDQRWEMVRQEALSVLEQVMRNPIREEDLPAMRQSVLSRVSLAFPEEQAHIIARLTQAFVTANRQYSPEATESARQAAREAVEPVVKRYVAGEIIIQRGEVITPEILEALQEMSLIGATDLSELYLGGLSLTAALMVLLGLYLLQKSPPWLLRWQHSAAILGLYASFLFTARWLTPGHAVLPYVFPIAAFALLLQALFGLPTALFMSLPLALLAVYNVPGMLNLGAFYLFTSLGGALTLGRARRVSAYLRAGVVMGLLGTAMVLAFRVPFLPLDWNGLLLLVGASFFNGLASAGLAFLLQYFLGLWLDLPTPIHLLEYARPDMPLLQRLLQKAPGTYQHSLQVANLAEQAAEAIGADALLVRVGALYHDIGKTENPGFFIENQLGRQIDTHDDKDAYQVAEAIIRHVTDGLALARRYRLPERIQDFIREHHGTMLTRYQYHQALEAANGDPNAVDESRFRYPGPRPRSRETALLMLADGVEARARAMHPDSPEALRALVAEAFDFIRQAGQLDDSPLTMRELSRIQEKFVDVLRGSYHPRVRYPQEDAQ